jgi:hypothetical protein
MRSLLLILALLMPLPLLAGTYYIANASLGNDTNDGLTKATPWQHAPGMPNCASACLAKANGTSFNGISYPAITGGDSFVFRGGDTWNFGNAAATNYVGGTWLWVKDGSSLKGFPFKRPTSAGATGSGSAWSNPAQALTFSTTLFNSTTTSSTSQNLDVTSFNFAIPANATITQIDLGWNGNLSPATGTYTVQLLQAGAPVGNSFSVVGGSPFYGNVVSGWGGSWTPAIVNTTGFGVRIIANGNGTSTTFNMNGVFIQVRYVLPGTADCDTSDDPNADRSTCISVGATDASWFSGAKWSRAILTGDNPTSLTPVASCTYPNIGGGNRMVQFNNTFYLWFRNFEMTGLCEGTPSSSANSWKPNWDGYIYETQSSFNLKRNIYSGLWIHGITHVPFSCVADPDGIHHDGICYPNGGFFGAAATMSTVEWNVVDGSDSDPSGLPAIIFGFSYMLHHNVFRYFSQGIFDSTFVTHDNRMEHYFPTGDGEAHGNAFKSDSIAPFHDVNGNDYTPYTGYVAQYNNVIIHADSSAQGDVKFWTCLRANTREFDFNWIETDVTPTNYWGFSNVCSLTTTGGYFHFNSTHDVPNLPISGGNTLTRLANSTYLNNHYITELGSPYTGSGGTVSNDVQMTHATAVTQGYMQVGGGTSSGNVNNDSCVDDTKPCAPAAIGNSTVGAGTAISSLCNEMLASYDKSIQRAGAACQYSTTGAVLWDATNKQILSPATTPVLRNLTNPRCRGV